MNSPLAIWRVDSAIPDRCISTFFFSFEYFDSFDHYAACWVTLSEEVGDTHFSGERLTGDCW